MTRGIAHIFSWSTLTFQELSPRQSNLTYTMGYQRSKGRPTVFTLRSESDLRSCEVTFKAVTNKAQKKITSILYPQVTHDLYHINFTVFTLFSISTRTSR